MKCLLLDLYVVFSLIIFAQITESIKVYVIDKHGHVSELRDHTHTSKYSHRIRDKIVQQLDNYLRKSKKHTPRSHHRSVLAKKKEKKTNTDGNEHKSKSPVIYSNGRYILDLDKIDVKDVKYVTNRPEKEKDYFDPADSFRDYYEFINLNDRLRSPTDEEISPSKTKKSKKKHFRRNFSQILFANKERFRSRNKGSGNENKRIKIKNKRFKVINNQKNKKDWTSEGEKPSKHKKKKKKIIAIDYDNSEFNGEGELSAEVSEEKNTSESESLDSEENHFIQGNKVKKIKGRERNINKRDLENDSYNSEESNSDSEIDNDSSDDSDIEHSSDESSARRRLPTFMPKRFHWDVDDIHKLGYFWFNGNRGRFPAPTPIT